MATQTNETFVEIADFSGAAQRKSTEFLAKPNQVNLPINVSFARIGGMEKSSGYTQIGNTITTSSSTSSSTSTSSSSTSTSTSTSSSTSTSTSTSSTTTP
jgi:hypothetical protein